MQNILLIRRIQSDIEWQEDCKKIAEDVLYSVGLEIPHIGYKNVFIDFLSYRLENYEEDNDLENFLSDVKSYGSDEVYSITYDMEVPNLDISKISISNLKQSIQNSTKNFYLNNKIELINNLECILSLQELIVIYPNNFYKGILNRFYKTNNKKFISKFNNDKECILEFSNLYGNDFKVIDFNYHQIQSLT